MGNQQSLIKPTVYQDEGKYIVPTKVKIPPSTENAQVLKNIFGVSDPAFLARSYWAKDEPYKLQKNQHDLSPSPSKSRRLGNSVVGQDFKGQSHGFEWAQQSIVRPEREIFGRSVVSNFRQDSKETPSRNLSKITSCSIISKLNQFQGDLQSTSPLKKLQKSSISNLYQNNKNKENISHQIQGSPVPSSNRRRKTQQFSNSPLQKSRLSNQRESKINDQVENQMSKIFGLSNVSHQQSRQRFCQNSRALDRKDQFTETDPIHQETQQIQHSSSSALNHEICEQTFSRFEESPTISHVSNQDKFSQASKKSKYSYVLSKKTHSKHSAIEKFDGLNEDSKNESLMKVLKRITQISIDDQNQSSKSQNAVRIHPLRENVSQIMIENLHRQETESKRSERSNLMRDQQTQKSQKYSESQKQQPIQFYLHEVKQSTSKNSVSNYQKSPLQSGKSSSNLSSQNGKSFKNFSQAPINTSKSQSKLSIHQLTQLHERKMNFYDNGTSFGYLENEQSERTEGKSSNPTSITNEEYFKFSKVKSPQSISSEQVGLNRQRSCAGRIIETSKAGNSKEYSSPFKSKKYDFSKKPSAQKEGSPSLKSRNQTSNRSPSSRKSTLKPVDSQLMLKIETLQDELNTLKLKEELEKFQSRRYSPVKQEKSKRKPVNQQDQDVEQKQQKYCINQFSQSTPFKHRSQYFKLKLK